MAKPTPWKDQYTLLCEKCGYVVEGLDQAGVCPECGKPIEESLPQRRVGTPWQQEPGFKSLLRTWWITLRHPKRTLDVMRVQSTTLSSNIIKPLLMIALLFVSTGSFLVLFFSKAFFLGFVVFPFYMGISSIGIFVILGLMNIESAGLRIISMRQGFRITTKISHTIVAHGSIGWAIIFIGLGIYWNTFLISILLGKSDNSDLNRIAEPILITGVGILIFSILFGFLFFEFFAYLGLRRCKYANRIRPQESDPGATTRP